MMRRHGGKRNPAGGRPEGREYEKRFVVSMTGDMHAKLKKLSERTGKSMAQLVREALEIYFVVKDVSK